MQQRVGEVVEENVDLKKSARKTVGGRAMERGCKSKPIFSVLWLFTF